MLNPDISNQNTSLKTSSNDLLNKSEICLFNFSKLKSRLNLTLSQNNSFNYVFSENEQNGLKNKFNKQIIESDRNRYIKKVNIEFPSSEKLIKEEFKNDILNNYDDSFAKYCGLDKVLFSELYINNRYNPTINEFGDINISINKIANVLKKYSHTKKIRITRRMRKRKKIKKNLAQNKYKKLFKINKIYKEKEESSDIKPEKIKNKLNNNCFDNDKEEINNDLKNIQSLVDRKNDDENYININEHQKTKTLFNIKKNLKNIMIPGKGNSQININENNNISNSISEKQNDIIKSNIDSENIINQNKFNFNKNKEKIISGNEKNLPSNAKENILSNQSFKQILKSSNSINNNNIFKSAYEIMGRQAITPFNKNNFSLNMSLKDNSNNNNTPSNRPILSPMNFNPGLDNINNILSPNIYEYPKDKISSPFFVNASPFNNNNFNDQFLFNNINNSSFLFGNNSENNNDNSSEELFNNNKTKDQINNDDINKNINDYNDENNKNNSKKEKKNHISKNGED